MFHGIYGYNIYGIKIVNYSISYRVSSASFITAAPIAAFVT